MTFKAKANPRFLALIFSPLLIIYIVVGFFAHETFSPSGILCIGLSFGILLYFVTTISYTLDPAHLTVRVGFIRMRTPLDQIERAFEANRIGGYPGLNAALDVHRVVIQLKTGWIRYINISPESREAFFNALKTYRPDVPISSSEV